MTPDGKILLLHLMHPSSGEWHQSPPNLALDRSGSLPLIYLWTGTQLNSQCGFAAGVQSTSSFALPPGPGCAFTHTKAFGASAEQGAHY